MIVQRVGPVLGGNPNVVDARIDAIGERKINETVFSGKGHRRFDALLRQNTQTCATAAGHYYR
jgi:hypothetical protein